MSEIYAFEELWAAEQEAFDSREAKVKFEGNLNDSILVRINPEGEAAWREYWKTDENPPRDEQGYTKMQLFDVMQMFGPHLHANLLYSLPIDPTFGYLDPEDTQPKRVVKFHDEWL